MYYCSFGHWTSICGKLCATLCGSYVLFRWQICYWLIESMFASSSLNHNVVYASLGSTSTMVAFTASICLRISLAISGMHVAAGGRQPAHGETPLVHGIIPIVALLPGTRRHGVGVNSNATVPDKPRVACSLYQVVRNILLRVALVWILGRPKSWIKMCIVS